ncbi:raffinose synthase [Bifidobacterium pullorum subsp. saeculare DSM 6531 = LMG 14934]|uniref:Raffinose synthase n=1 Tax=Bifidobacterium pullorum subsp. saeculare DSM 6531 = LMG 14934 TaxID=1437611 RepID=A0A087CQU0_9BIFI|nr:Sip1-related alpha-galactosidase [Bifidobacterium pullorum]KFI85640.1 raffinose synthase [Bifidobacterium pullorum subsp. saeculare DSM 6531 = LMG 14934]
MPVREPSRPAAPPLSVGGARIVVRPGGHGAGLRPAAAVPVPDDAFTVTAEREGLWRLDAAVAVPQPPDRAARFQEQDTLDPDLALDAAVMFPGSAPHGPFLCLYQHKEWWMRPAWRDALADVPERTQMILWRDDDAWTALVAVCGDDARADLHGDALAVGTVRAVDDARDADAAAAVPASGLRIALSSNRVGRTALADVAAYLAVAADPYDAIRACVDAAAKRLGIATADRRPLPEALSGFGWCTWDSLGRDVSEAAIIEKMEEFHAKGVPVSWVMIDDGWSRTDREAETLIGLDADPERFPHGLAHTVDLLRERYGVRRVGVWAAFQGYWSGLESNGQAVALIGAEHLAVTSNGCLIPGPGRRQATMFWATWLSLLRDMGIDCVKVDSQSSMSTMTRGVESYGEATIERHAALDRLVETEMGGAMINCMGMAPESYWHRPVSAVTRTSDDFLPHDPASLAEHLLQNAYCSLLMGELYRCDWDMFWTSHPHARTHALMRALSAGPVYCSDAAGRTDPAVLGPLLLNDGRVPRPDTAAVPVPSALLADPTCAESAWCVTATCGDWRLLAFVGMNPDQPQRIRLHEALRGLPACADGGERWVVDREAMTAERLRPGADEGSAGPLLAYGESRLYYVWDGPWDAAVMPLGLIDKIVAPATVAVGADDDSGIGTGDQLSDSEAMAVRLAEPGRFALLDPDARCVDVRCNGETVPVHRNGALCMADCDDTRVDIRWKA